MSTPNDSRRRGEALYTLTFLLSGPYLLLINFVFEPSALRNWFLRTASVEAAAINLIVLALVVLSLGLFFKRMPLFVRWVLLGLLLVLGSFMKVSGDIAPLFALLLLVVGAITYLLLKLRSKKQN